MSILNFENWVPLVDGATELCFRPPDKDELVWALDAMDRVGSLNPKSPEMKALVMQEIPKKLGELLTNIKLPGGATPLPNWKEEVQGSVVFAHNDGIKMVDKVFFRSRLKADKPSPARPE